MAETMLSEQAGYKNETVVMAQPVDLEIARLNQDTVGLKPAEPVMPQSTERGLTVAGPDVTDQYGQWSTKRPQV